MPHQKTTDYRFDSTIYYGELGCTCGHRCDLDDVRDVYFGSLSD